ncbi:hypothetical protein [uncultured Clostridium sp.]|uniref:hypothetical protein n=1 Tax=uncultured Clostridium sp. TaxID=59620 RepID=UPI0026343151|nr:hypothetical protein [uncultured Clostridium sp.]
MKQIKNLCFAFLIALIIFLSLGIDAHAMENTIKNVYTTSNFNLNGEHLNFVINSIDKNSDVLILDTYLINSHKDTIKEIKNFKIKATDTNGITVLDDTFPVIELQKDLESKDGVRVILYSNLDGTVNFDKLDTSDLNYSFSYDYI